MTRWGRRACRRWFDAGITLLDGDGLALQRLSHHGSASSRCDCFDMFRFSSSVAPRSWKRSTTCDWRNRQCGFAAYFRISVLPGSRGRRICRSPWQPSNCNLQRPYNRILVQPGSGWKRTGGRPPSRSPRWCRCRHRLAPRLRPRRRARKTANTYPATLSTGAKPFVFFAIMRCNHAWRRTSYHRPGPPKGRRC